jgi:hypothetical protein
MTNTENQEAVAKKILEGIVAYKNQLNEKPATPVVNL